MGRCQVSIETELAWAAGFFDGEGNTHQRANRPGLGGLSMQVNQQEPTTLERFGSAVGYGKLYGPYAERQTGSVYRWLITGHKVQLAVDRLWPYLSEPKRKQILLIGLQEPK